MAWAKGSCPVLLNNVISKNPVATTLPETFKDICRVAYSPVHNTALMLRRNGILNIASFTTGKKIRLSKKKMKINSENWNGGKLGFSADGLLGIALDQSGRLLGVKLTTQ